MVDGGEKMNVVKRKARWDSIRALIGLDYEWLACDRDRTIFAYEDKPFKLTEDEWNFNDDGAKYLRLSNAHYIDFVKWEDDEPVNIREWLEKEEEEMKMYSVKDGELQCKEVDADFFKKYTTLGELLSSDEIELDQDNKLVEPVKVINPFLTFTDLHPPMGQDYDETDCNGGSNPVLHEFICDELYETYKKKNADYGNSFENSLDKHGLIAGIVRMDDKMSRLISLNSKNEQLVLDESLRDTLMDLANYAIMSVMWLDEK